MVIAWGWIVHSGSIGTIWPMFGIANQLLASVALAVGTSVIVNSGKARWAWVTLIPLAFVGTTTLVAGWLSITQNFLKLKTTQGWIDAVLTAVLMVCLIVVLVEAARAWLAGRKRAVAKLVESEPS